MQVLREDFFFITATKPNGNEVTTLYVISIRNTQRP